MAKKKLGDDERKNIRMFPNHGFMSRDPVGQLLLSSSARQLSKRRKILSRTS